MKAGPLVGHEKIREESESPLITSLGSGGVSRLREDDIIAGSAGVLLSAICSIEQSQPVLAM